MLDARRLRAFALFLFAAVVVGVGVRAATRALGDGAPGDGAEWIWADGAAEAGRPMAFWAVRDVELASVPEEAWLTIVVDESYVLWINGRRAGSGRWRPGAAVDRYQVARFLEAGSNRLAVEARSARGAGGLLATLRVGAGEELVTGTDASWRIVRFEAPGLLAGLGQLEDFGGVAPRIWGAPPTGRWRPRAASNESSEAEESSMPADQSNDAEAGADRSVDAVRVRHATRGDTWVDLRPLERLPELADQLVFDFGAVVEGSLDVGLPCGTSGESRAEIEQVTRPMLLFFADEPPDVTTARPDEVLVAVPGACAWRDVVSRRFRYVGLVGGAPHRRIAVAPARAGEVVDDDDAAQRGVFGLPPARGWSAVEEDVWGRLAAATRESAETP
ncbi:MAG: hypothetical protein AAGC60_08145 [Acidobacteriota bacterium]